MPTWIPSLITAVSHTLAATADQSPLPLLIVAAYAGASGFLYALTRGKEFLFAGYSSVLFLAPFVHMS